MLTRVSPPLAVCLLLLAVSAAPASSAEAVSFQMPYTAYNTGNNPRAVATGDWSGDGLPDLVTADLSGNSVSFFRGVGAGLFRRTGSGTPGLAPRDIALADMNNDTYIDVITCNFESNSVQFFTNRGDGTFYIDTNISTGRGAAALAIADFNRDGAPDITTANAYDNTVSIVLLGEWPWQQFNLPTGSFPLGIAAGDVNGDGMLDIVTANAFSDDIAIFPGRGDGTFEEPRRVPVGAYPVHVTIGELDGDGVDDIVVANHFSSTLSLIMSSHDMRHVAAGSMPIASAIGDIDRDGVNEVVSAAFSEVYLWVFENDGVGEMQLATRLLTPAGPVGVSLADVNGDEWLDVIATAQVIGAAVVILGNGDGTHGQEPRTFTTPADPRVLEILDLEQDGKPELVVAGLTGRIRVFAGDGLGSFTPRSELFGPEGTEDIVVADLTGDGRPDVVTVQPESQSLTAMTSVADGVLSVSSVSTFGEVVTSVAPSGVNGARDLYATLCSAPGSVVTLSGDGAGQFVQGDAIGVMDCPSDIAVSDIDQDGYEDIVLARPENLSILWGLGDHTFQDPVRLQGGYDFIAIGVGHFDGDASIDIAAVAPNSGAIIVALARPGRAFELMIPVAAGRGAMNVAVGDVDGDGIDDIATASPRDKHVTVILNAVGGKPKSVQRFGTTLTPRWVQIADVTSDGNPDVVFLSQPDGHVVVAPQMAALRPLRARIDISPHDKSNTVNPRSRGVLSVAVFGAALLSVRSIDLERIELAGAAAELWRFSDIDGDGHEDAVFRTRENALQLVPGDTVAVLAAWTLEGRAIEGSDRINLKVPAGRSEVGDGLDQDATTGRALGILAVSADQPARGVAVTFSAKSAGRCVLEVFDVLGRRVAAKWVEVSRPGVIKTDVGQGLAMGLHFVRLKQHGVVALSRAVVLR